MSPMQLRCKKALVCSVVDPKLFVTDPDPYSDPTFSKSTGSGSDFQKVPDTVSDPTLNIYTLSGTVILRSFKSTLKYHF
jgi:hypothetical protein